MRLSFLFALYSAATCTLSDPCHSEAVSICTERGDDVRDEQTAAEQNIPHTELVIDDSAKADNLDDQVRAHYASRECHLEFTRNSRVSVCLHFSRQKNLS